VVVLVLILSSFLLIAGRHVVRTALEHIYTPPALTKEKADVYLRFLGIVGKYPEYEKLSLDRWGRLSLDMRWSLFFLDKPSYLKELEQKRGFSKEDLVELTRISRDFKRVGCLFARRYSGVVVFVPRRNHIMPTRPGVLYSLDCVNPNHVDNEFLNPKKSFIPIGGRWYASKQLVASPFREIDDGSPLPKSLIDHSLRTSGFSITNHKSNTSGGETKAASPQNKN
jgi:hypothetical protein